MALLTTCIGAYPKPDFVALPDWFNLPSGTDSSDPTQRWDAAMNALGPNAEDVITRGVKQALDDQLSAGIDIPTDGEIPRENYVHYHCRHLHGVDFSTLTEKSLRGGSYAARLPTIVGRISVRKKFMVDEWKRAQQFTDKPVKVTMPGPMTVTDTTANSFYPDVKALGADIADALNEEVRALAQAGCRHIQIDEPMFARKPAEALEYGFDHLERAFHSCPADVVRTVHMCCGYPDRLDHPDYPKADLQAYHQLVDAVDYSAIDAVSFEDAHRPNNLQLLEQLTKTTAILGVVAIARSRVETSDEIEERLRQALLHIDRERLIAAPDCGLGFLSRDLAIKKLRSLCIAASRI